MNLQGGSSQHPSPVFQSVSALEYQNTKIFGLKWSTGGDAELRLFSLNIQKSLSQLYFTRFLGTLAYRFALYDAAGFAEPEGNKLGGDLRITQSAVLRLGMGVSSAILTSLPFRITLYLQGSLKLSKFSQSPAGISEVIAINPYIGISY
jgi:hypothetical protein